MSEMSEMPEMSLPPKQKAIIGRDDGTFTISDDVDIPKLGNDIVLVRTRAIGLNPMDTKLKGKLAAPGCVAGIDWAGDVIAIGPQCRTPAEIRVGDRVCGAVIGYDKRNPAVGAWAEMVAATDAGVMKIPDGMSYEQGASLGCVVSTIGLALFRSLGVPGNPKSPAKNAVNVFVYGGSTSTGTMAIQLLKM